MAWKPRDGMEVARALRDKAIADAKALYRKRAEVFKAHNPRAADDRQVERWKQEAEALELDRAGLTGAAIARKLGVSAEVARGRVSRALRHQWHCEAAERFRMPLNLWYLLWRCGVRPDDDTPYDYGGAFEKFERKCFVENRHAKHRPELVAQVELWMAANGRRWMTAQEVAERSARSEARYAEIREGRRRELERWAKENGTFDRGKV